MTRSQPKHRPASLSPPERQAAIQSLVRSRREAPSWLRWVTAFRHFLPEPARTRDFPDSLAEPVREAYRRRGVTQLYSHQREALDRLEAGENVAIGTPTASGKTLCYNAPVLNRLLREPDARALYLFPTKALSRDQIRELQA